MSEADVYRSNPIGAASETLLPGPAVIPEPAHGHGSASELSARELHFRILEHLAPPSMVVSADLDFIHATESAGRYLQFSGGEPTRHLLSMVHPLIRAELRWALLQAAEKNQTIVVPEVPFSEAHDGQGEGTTGRNTEAVTLRVSPVGDIAPGHLLITFERCTPSALPPNYPPGLASLLNANQELKRRVDELSHTNGDLHHLMNATGIATIFLDGDLRFVRYTQAAVEIFKLTSAEIGQPLSALQQHLDYPALEADARHAIEQRVPVEREVGAEGRWFLARLLPYRTVDDRVAHVVLTLVDVTARKEAERALELDLQETERLRLVGEHLVPDGEMQTLFDGILRASMAIAKSDAGTVQLLDTEMSELVILATSGFSKEITAIFARVDASSGSPCGRALSERQRIFMDFDAPGDPDLDGSNALHLAEDMRSAQSTPLIARSGRLIGMLSTHWKDRHRPSDRELRYLDLLARQAADAIERKQANEALHRHMNELSRFNAVAVGRESRMIELKKEVNALKARLGEPAAYALDFDKEKEE